MREIEIPSDFEPSRAPALFAALATVANEAGLEFTFLADGSERPSLLVLLAAFIEERRRLGLDHRLSPRSRANLGSLTPFFSRKSEATSGERGPADLVHPLRTLADAHDLAELAANGLIAQSPGLSPSLVRMARFVFEELGANVVQHSRAPDTGHGSMRIVRRELRFELAFADRGVGFLASLNRNPELAGRVSDDGEALQLALTARISGTDSSRSNMGIGLKQLVDFSDVLSGDLHLASGGALLTRKTLAGQRANVVRAIAPWQGSWICLDAPLPGAA